MTYKIVHYKEIKVIDVLKHEKQIIDIYYPKIELDNNQCYLGDTIILTCIREDDSELIERTIEFTVVKRIFKTRLQTVELWSDSVIDYTKI